MSDYNDNGVHSISLDHAVSNVRLRVAPCSTVVAAGVGSLPASWVDSWVVKPVAGGIEINRMFVLAKPVARQIEQLQRK